jgi:(R,R)-butanediol dehydrogenase / meso-butanediol dehydrogenase / diacetyl reductase
MAFGEEIVVLAAVLYGPEDLRIENLPVPEPGRDYVQVKVAHNGICGSDLHRYYTSPGPDQRPQILGHELSGTVTEVGPGVRGLSAGTRVAVRATWGCDECPQCRMGVPHLCPKRISFSQNTLSPSPGPAPGDPVLVTAFGAGLSQYVAVPQKCLVPLADNVSLAQGALIEPMSVAFNGVLRSGAAPGKSAFVVGAGPIGIGVFLGLRALGVEQILVSEPSPVRREAISSLGATTVLDPTAEDVPAVVRELTGGLGADAVIEAAGTPRSFASALDSCAPRGRVALLAIFEKSPRIEPFDLIRRELDLVGAIGYNRATFQRVHDLMVEGKYPTAGWVEHVCFDDLAQSIEQLRRGERMKLLVDLPV